MKKHTKKEIKEMLKKEYGACHKDEKIIDIYNFMSIHRPVEFIKVFFLSPVTHTIYKETYSYDHTTQVFDFIRVDGIL